MKKEEQVTGENKINLIVDIDLLGLGYVYPKARTGVFRVTEELLTSFLSHSGLEVHFSAQSNLSDAIAYLEKASLMQNAKFVHSKAELSKAASLNQLRAICFGNKFLERVFRKVRRYFFQQTAGFSELPTNPVYFSTYNELPKAIQDNKSIKKVILIHDLISVRLP